MELGLIFDGFSMNKRMQRASPHAFVRISLERRGFDRGQLLVLYQHLILGLFAASESSQQCLVWQ